MTSLVLEKQALRKTILSKLSALNASELQTQSSRVIKNLFNLPEFQKASSLGVFLSMPKGEIRTDEIVREALAQSKEVYIPYTRRNYDLDDGRPRNIMDLFSLLSESDFSSLTPDKLSIRKPQKDSLAQRKDAMDSGSKNLDLIIMPGVAFDQRLNRLGHGQGCYDFFLSRYSKRQNHSGSTNFPFLVGLALEEQILPASESIPIDTTDYPLDCLLVGDDRVIRYHNSEKSITLI